MKKKILHTAGALITAVTMAFLQCQYALAVDSGSGSAADPYKISSEADFADIEHNPSASYVLTKDIVVKKGLDITDFKGTLDGNGHRIELRTSSLFNTVSGSVKNIGIHASSVPVGALAQLLTGEVSQSVFSGEIKATPYLDAGGIAGTIEGGSVTDCIVDITVGGTTGVNIGAIAGKAANAKITDCFTDSEIKTSGNVTAAVVGVSENSELSDIYYNADKTNLPYGVGIGSDTTTPVRQEELCRAVSYPGLSFGSVWTIIEGSTSPMLVAYNGNGTQYAPYKIHTASDLEKVTSDDNTEGRYYKLEADINFSKVLGSEDAPFSGHFDGNNHRIQTAGRGAFRVIGEKGSVENIVNRATVNDRDIAGGIADINYGTIKNCYVHGSIRATKDAGGIVGENIGGTVQDCYFSGSLSVSSTGGGGIVGYNSYGRIEGCAARISITGRDHSIGGIAGDNSYGVIRNCYASGTVKQGSEVGGIAGRLYNGSIITSYADCSLSGTEDIGGLFGARFEDAYVENSYYTVKSGEPETINAEQKEKYGRSDDAMKAQASYAGFDFEGVWAIDEGVEKPVLKSVNGAGTKEEPYKIRTEEDFRLVIKDDRRLYYELECDMPDLTTHLKEAPFLGSLDGKGHSITNTDTNCLFSKVEEGAYIGNLTLIGENICNEAVGATIEYCSVIKNTGNVTCFINTMKDCTVRNCRVREVSSNGAGSVAGGFAENITGGIVSDCAVIDSKVKASNVAGGFVGIASEAKIERCFTYNTDVEGPSAGGFVGRNDNNTVITDCNSYGTVSGGSYTGSFAGMNYAEINGSVSYSKPADNTADDTAADTEISFAGYDSGTVSGSKNISVSQGDNSGIYRIISTGGIATTVNAPDLPSEEKAVNAPSVALTDISGHWAEATITKLVGKGVINGYEDGTYRPQNSVTKAEFITLLLSATNTKLRDGFTNYEDVNKHWAKNRIYTAVSLGITDNINEGTAVFGADSAITRAEAVALMGRLIANGEGGTLSFTDNDDIPSWAVNEVGACVGKGIINGMDDGSFAPNKSLTRAESAIIIDKLMEIQ